MASFVQEAEETVIPHPSAPRPTPEQAALANILAAMLNVKALADRAVIALARLYALLLAGSVFTLAWQALGDPSYLKLALLGAYGVFVIAILAIRKGV